MKYLIFNFAVFLALGYLIVGEKTPVDLTTEIQQAGARIQEVVTEKPKPAPRPERPLETEQVVDDPFEYTPPPRPVAEPAPKLVEAEPVSPPLPEPVEIAKPDIIKVPSPRIEPTPAPIEMVDAAPEIAPNTSGEDTLEKARLRSESLRQMAQEMEQMFAEKMTW